MANAVGGKRTDSGSRLIKASPQTVYRAFLDPEAVASWRPPEGMKAHIHAFDPREGGAFRMSFIYAGASEGAQGKTSERVDMFHGHFAELVPDRRIVEIVEFESDDPAFTGAMTVITEFAPALDGCEVTIRCGNVPAGISADDHEKGIASTLANLAAFTE